MDKENANQKAKYHGKQGSTRLNLVRCSEDRFEKDYDCRRLNSITKKLLFLLTITIILITITIILITILFVSDNFS